jgi:ribonucleoside-diphosphate reductase alpha chain
VSKKTYTYEEVLQSSTAYFQGDELAASSWVNKYAMKDRNGAFLETTPEDMHRRMASAFAKKEKAYAQKKLSPARRKLLSPLGQERKPLTEKKIFDYFNRFSSIIPQGSVMSSLGNPHTVASLSNCIVLPEIYDSYGGILYTDQQLAQLFKRRCGVGIDISSLRPSGMFVGNAAGTTSGAVSFMERFSNTTREVAQNGRRGALMITMDIAHPDIAQFIISKQDLQKITGANISVRISDEFMRAVEAGKKFTLRFPLKGSKPRYTLSIDARELWKTLIQCARNTAEPGVIFWDRQHHYSTSSVYPGFENISTNPCSEIAMQGGDSCRLIALNLFSFVNNPFTSTASFDHNSFRETVYDAQRLMDDLVDLELDAIDRILAKIKRDPEPSRIRSVEQETWELIHKNGKKGRRTGLGFTALGDTLAALGHAFDSDRGLAETEKIMRTKCSAEFDSSVDMAIERGKFSAFDPSVENKSDFIRMMKKEFPSQYKRMMRYGRRNISISTVAPTGTLSLLSQTSSGIEPVFMLSYTRRRKVNPLDKNSKVDFTDASGDRWQEFSVFHPGLKKWMEVSGKKDILQSPYFGSTAPVIDWKKRIELQSIVQKYTTHSISSTINLPADVTAEQVGDIYLEAWKKGLKGITIYREGSRSGVLLPENETIPVHKTETVTEIKRDHTCPQCADPDGIIYEEGCLKCKSCGYGLCG